MRRVLAAALVAVAACGGPSRAPQGLITADGRSLLLAGRSTVLVGVNDYHVVNRPGGYVCDTQRPVLADLGPTFQRYRESGATVVRTWFFQSYATGDRWAAFDRVLAAAGAAGIRVEPVLANSYADCDGAAKDVAFYAGGYRSPGYGQSLAYRGWVQQVVQRYAGDPRVAFWQLVNEVDPAGCTASTEDAVTASLVAFASDVGGLVRTLDPAHLVSLGTQGSDQCGTSGPRYAQVHAVPSIGLCEVHDYSTATEVLPAFLQARLDQCAALGKPLVVGEAGVVASVSTDGSRGAAVTPDSLARRASFLAAKLAAARAAGVAGWSLWQATSDPSTSAVNAAQDLYGIGPGDPALAVLRG